jgi:hypothetical protein
MTEIERLKLQFFSLKEQTEFFRNIKSEFYRLFSDDLQLMVNDIENQINEMEKNNVTRNY